MLEQKIYAGHMRQIFMAYFYESADTKFWCHVIILCCLIRKKFFRKIYPKK